MVEFSLQRTCIMQRLQDSFYFIPLFGLLMPTTWRASFSYDLTMSRHKKHPMRRTFWGLASTRVACTYTQVQHSDTNSIYLHYISEAEAQARCLQSAYSF